jgi:hypothetical protein
MTAEPLLELTARLLAKHRLDAVLIGNAAAALQGSPVTTVDLDFMFRKSAGNLTKLRRIADDLRAVVMRPFYPASELYRVVRDSDGLQLDFMAKVDGVRSFESLRSRATEARFGRYSIKVAPSKTSSVASEPRIARRIAPCYQSCAGHSVKKVERRRRRHRSALQRESDRALIEQIRRLLALPMEKRTNFLRVRHYGKGSHI